jgi:hypothetical protein
MWLEFQTCNNQTFDILPINRCGGAHVVWPWNEAMINVFTPSSNCFTGKGDANHKLLECQLVNGNLCLYATESSLLRAILFSSSAP